MKNKYVRFFAKLGLLFVTLLILDVISGKIFHYILTHAKSGNQAATTYAVTRADPDIIILGSSRAQHHYIPTVFRDELHLNAYNAGCDGMTFLYYYSIFRSVLSREVPKAVIVDMLPDEFAKSDRNYTSLAALLPYYNTEPAIRPVLDLRSPYERVKTLSNLYRYNSVIGPTIRDLLLGGHSDDGYKPLYGKLDEQAKLGTVHTVGNNVDTVMVNKFRQMISDTKAANCKLFVFISPAYQHYQHPHKSTQIIEKICKENKVYFKDFIRDSFFLQRPEDFANTFHLNNSGATLYSEMVVKNIRQSLTSEIKKDQLTTTAIIGKLDKAY